MIKEKYKINILFFNALVKLHVRIVFKNVISFRFEIDLEKGRSNMVIYFGYKTHL